MCWIKLRKGIDACLQKASSENVTIHQMEKKLSNTDAEFPFSVFPCNQAVLMNISLLNYSQWRVSELCRWWKRTAAISATLHKLFCHITYEWFRNQTIQQSWKNKKQQLNNISIQVTFRPSKRNRDNAALTVAKLYQKWSHKAV